ncbi:DUF5998 family protein [Georgenia faecalis]|uniref:DUF5998 family protein n=1 Tax=Georgenia faecalis TaxID=2483799 RepID=A0ABV9DB21_9MICO
MTSNLADQLRSDLDRAGYYPELVARVLEVALAGEPVISFLVHPETTFDTEVRRHLTALVLTPTRLVIAHVDDTAGEVPSASATTEAVPLHRISSVALTHGVADPARTRGGMQVTELTVAVGWGAIQRLDLEPMACDDPACEADHGYTGLLSPDDVVVRVSEQAEGSRALARALQFARDLSAATVGRA